MIHLTALSLFSQDNCVINTSDEVAKKIVSSDNYKDINQMQNEIYDKIDNLIANKNFTADNLKEVFLNAEKTNNYVEVNSLVFGNQENANEFFSKYQKAKAEFIASNQQIGDNCTNTSTSNSQIISAYFDNYNNSYAQVKKMLGSGEDTDATGCSRLKLSICGAACGLSTAGWGAVWCLWGCACVFCDRDFHDICGPIKEQINSERTK